MRRAVLFAAALGLVALTSCGSSRPHLVSPAEVRNVRVYVNERPVLGSTDDDCRPYYPVLEKSLPYFVRRRLAESGFTLVRDPAQVHDAQATISGNFSYCRKEGTCVNGSAEVALVSNGVVVERHRYDTGNALCASAPTVDEFPGLLVEDLQGHLLDSRPVAALARSVNQIKAEYEAGLRAGVAPVSPAPAPATAGPAPQQTAQVALAEYVQGAPQPTAFALVVGIEKYRDVPAPAGARADAVDFARVAQRTLGLREDHVRVLLDENATRADLQKGLGWLELNVPVGGRVYFFYSGHGAPDPVKGTAYVLPYDGDPAALEQTALPLSEITDALSKTKASDSIAFLDSCFSGAGGRSVLASGTRPLVRVQTPAVARGVSVLSSSGAAEISGASAEGGHGLFSKYLLQGLGEARADADGDLQISLSELLGFVEPRVAREARLSNRVQTPALALPDGAAAGSVIVAFGVKR